MQVKIDQVFLNSTKPDGSPLLDKNGAPYKMCVIVVGDKKYSLFLGQKFGAKDLSVVSQWKAGDTVDIITEMNGSYLNFKLPKITDELEERLRIVESQVKTLQAMINGKQAMQTEEPPMQEPNF